MKFDVQELSQKEFNSMLIKYLSDYSVSISEMLSIPVGGHGHFEHEGNNFRNINKNINTTCILNHNITNSLICDCLLQNRKEIYEFITRHNYGKLAISLTSEFAVGGGYCEGKQDCYFTNDLRLVLVPNIYTPPGFGLLTYYPDISKNHFKLSDNHILFSFDKISKEFEINKDDFICVLGLNLDDGLDNQEFIMDKQLFLEYLKETESIEYKLNSQQLSDTIIQEKINKYTIDKNYCI